MCVYGWYMGNHKKGELIRVNRSLEIFGEVTIFLPCKENILNSNVFTVFTFMLDLKKITVFIDLLRVCYVFGFYKEVLGKFSSDKI